MSVQPWGNFISAPTLPQDRLDLGLSYGFCNPQFLPPHFSRADTPPQPLAPRVAFPTPIAAYPAYAPHSIYTPAQVPAQLDARVSYVPSPGHVHGVHPPVVYVPSYEQPIVTSGDAAPVALSAHPQPMPAVPLRYETIAQDSFSMQRPASSDPAAVAAFLERCHEEWDVSDDLFDALVGQFNDLVQIEGHGVDDALLNVMRKAQNRNDKLLEGAPLVALVNLLKNGIKSETHLELLLKKGEKRNGRDFTSRDREMLWQVLNGKENVVGPYVHDLLLDALAVCRTHNVEFGEIELKAFYNKEVLSKLFSNEALCQILSDASGKAIVLYSLSPELPSRIFYPSNHLIPLEPQNCLVIGFNKDNKWCNLDRIKANLNNLHAFPSQPEDLLRIDRWIGPIMKDANALPECILRGLQHRDLITQDATQSDIRILVKKHLNEMAISGKAPPELIRAIGSELQIDNKRQIEWFMQFSNSPGYEVYSSHGIGGLYTWLADPKNLLTFYAEFVSHEGINVGVAFIEAAQGALRSSGSSLLQIGILATDSASGEHVLSYMSRDEYPDPNQMVCIYQSKDGYFASIEANEQNEAFQARLEHIAARKAILDIANISNTDERALRAKRAFPPHIAVRPIRPLKPRRLTTTATPRPAIVKPEVSFSPPLRSSRGIFAPVIRAPQDPKTWWDGLFGWISLLWSRK